MNALCIPVSFGEAADKVTILEIKRERIADPGKIANIEVELELLRRALLQHTRGVAAFGPLFDRLKDINGRLWDVEENIRECENQGDFGPEFVRLARAVYQTNDERTRVKREVDLLFGSALLEEKSYVEHAGSLGTAADGTQGGEVSS